MKYIIGEKAWKEEYQKLENRKRIWIYIKFSNHEIIFLREYSQWLTVQDYCREKKIFIRELGIQYRTHRVVEKFSKADDVYLVRSLKADFGSNPKQCYTIGKVNGQLIHKKTWIVPELTFTFSSVDTVETSFAEAIVINDEEKTQTIQ